MLCASSHVRMFLANKHLPADLVPFKLTALPCQLAAVPKRLCYISKHPPKWNLVNQSNRLVARTIQLAVLAGSFLFSMWKTHYLCVTAHVFF